MGDPRGCGTPPVSRDPRGCGTPSTGMPGPGCGTPGAAWGTLGALGPPAITGPLVPRDFQPCLPDPRCCGTPGTPWCCGTPGAACETPGIAEPLGTAEPLALQEPRCLGRCGILPWTSPHIHRGGTGERCPPGWALPALPPFPRGAPASPAAPVWRHTRSPWRPAPLILLKTTPILGRPEGGSWGSTFQRRLPEPPPLARPVHPGGPGAAPWPGLPTQRCRLSHSNAHLRSD